MRQSAKKTFDFVELLKRQNIFIFGTGYSEIVCQYFYKKLLINDFRTYKADGLEFHSFLHHRNIDIGSVIFVSKSGTTSYIVQIAQQAKKQGVPIISFTGNMSNPLKELSDIAFVIEDGIKYDYDNSEYTPFLGQTILLLEKLMNEFTSEVNTALKKQWFIIAKTSEKANNVRKSQYNALYWLFLFKLLFL